MVILQKISVLIPSFTEMHDLQNAKRKKQKQYVEKRRRGNIKKSIEELAFLIPEARRQVKYVLSYFKPTKLLISENVAKT